MAAIRIKSSAAARGGVGGSRGTRLFQGNNADFDDGRRREEPASIKGVISRYRE